MKRTLLLCFIHGFKGDGETFYTFPQSLKKHVAEKLPDDDVELLLYPKYETRGSLLDSTDKFLEWLKGKVMEIRKEKTQNPWPPNDRSVGVILVAHSMGGFVASDALFSILNDHHDQEEKDTNHVIFPLIQGILAFDTPYNGLARSMFVYGAFSQYNKVSNIWNIMSAASAGLISARSLTTMSAKQAARQAGSSMVATTRTASPGWKIWEGIAVKSGVVGAIAAGGVAAYRNRGDHYRGRQNLNKNSIKEGAEQGYDALGQGLAYINRDSVGQSFAWLSSHLKFVGALMRQKEMVQRLERLSKVEGIGIRNFYTSLGENGYWSGGYFVPERTFCAIPAPGQKSHELFIRSVNGAVEDEVHAHMSMFKPETHDNYDKMSQQARDLVVEWFQSDNKVVDIPPLPELLPETAPEKDATGVQTEEGEIFTGTESESVPNLDMDGVDESPLDIVAAAAAIPLPDIQENDLDGKQRESYLQSLYRISQRAGSGLTGVASTGLKAGAAIPGFASKGVSSLWSSSKSKLESEASTNVEELSESMTIDADDDVRNEDKKGSVWAFRSFFPSRTKKDEKVDDNEDGRMDESKVDNHRTQLE